MEKQITYTTKNSYSVLNRLTDQTLYQWMTFHGLGYLSRYFIRYFETLNPKENFIIAPQAPSKYYQKDFKYVGACWLTREATKTEIKNVIQYIHTIYQKEITKTKPLILLGYSQGVSVMLRWMITKKINPTRVIIHSGTIPQELTPKHFSYLKNLTQFYLVYGNNDIYFGKKKIQGEAQLAQKLFKSNLQIISFKGEHEVNLEVVKQLFNNKHLVEGNKN